MSNYTVGINVELFAVQYLQDLGYEILAQRYKTKYGEIDIIARQDDTTVFIEVKFRKYIVASREAISVKQQQRIRDSAELFILDCPNINYRFDAILFDKLGKLEHIENAF